MSVRFIEETPGTRALVRRVADRIQDYTGHNLGMDEAESLAREILQLVGQYREHEVYR